MQSAQWAFGFRVGGVWSGAFKASWMDSIGVPVEMGWSVACRYMQTRVRGRLGRVCEGAPSEPISLTHQPARNDQAEESERRAGVLKERARVPTC